MALVLCPSCVTEKLGMYKKMHKSNSMFPQEIVE